MPLYRIIVICCNIYIIIIIVVVSQKISTKNRIYHSNVVSSRHLVVKIVHCTMQLEMDSKLTHFVLVENKGTTEETVSHHTQTANPLL